MPDWAPIILDGLADGKSLRTICKGDDVPAISTVMKAISEDPALAEQYARARAAGDDAMAEDIQSIADDPKLDPNDKRVRIDARKWLLAKRQPKKYGDRLEIDQRTEVTHRHDLSGYSADELDTLERLVAKGANNSGDTGGAVTPQPDSVH